MLPGVLMGIWFGGGAYVVICMVESVPWRLCEPASLGGGCENMLRDHLMRMSL